MSRSELRWWSTVHREFTRAPSNGPLVRHGGASRDSLDLLWLTPSRIDLGAAFLQDFQPRFLQPVNISTRGSDITPMQTAELFPGLSEDTEISHVCENAKRLNIQIEKRFATARDELWSDVLFPQFHLAPILDDLLSMPRASVMDGAYASSKELFRLAAILYICSL